MQLERKNERKNIKQREWEWEKHKNILEFREKLINIIIWKFLIKFVSQAIEEGCVPWWNFQ